MNYAISLICRTLGVATERDAHSAVLDRVGCQEAASIAGLAAVQCVRRALESPDQASPLESRVEREIQARGYLGPVERAAFALAAEVVTTAG